VASSDLVGIYLSVYVKKSLAGSLKKIDIDSVKTGLKGALGNKGGVLVSFSIEDSVVVFCNCHLSAGEK